MKKQLYLRCFGELNDFFKNKKRKRKVFFKDRQTIKDIIESVNIPHTEVYLIIKENEPITFNHLVKDGDIISIYPFFRTIEIESDLKTTRKKFEGIPKFIADVHLGKVVSYLRILGFDTLYHNNYDDQILAELSIQQKRILLTRDHGLLMRKIVKYGYFIRSDNPKEQLKEIILRYNLFKYINRFSRCPKCNGILKKVKKDLIIDRLEPKTKKYYKDFQICSNCNKIYWKGSHFKNIDKLINKIKDEYKNGL